MKKREGFTLLELLIVVIIVGVLASLALPRFFRGVERARWAEAKSILGAIRGAQIRYYAEYSIYTDTLADLDVELAGGRYFNFSVADNPVTTIGIAARNSTNNAAGVPAVTAVISIGEDGDFVYSADVPAWLQ